jgi:DNA ligase D-like protein (predicted 3'-phosphoesterase)
MDTSRLNEYWDKRDFNKTIEPEGEEKSSRGKKRFVIQEHKASQHHFDLRLEMDDVLKSWAVPKGPSMDPSVKRMAVQTEDHPLEYIDFEGTIPEDEYGGGTVIVWDGGTYRNIREEKKEDKKDMMESIEEGKIEVWLNGKKISGGFVLIRTGSKKDNKWLLKKMKDEEADARRNPVSTEQKSILSNKTVNQVEKEMNNK